MRGGWLWLLVATLGVGRGAHESVAAGRNSLAMGVDGDVGVGPKARESSEYVFVDNLEGDAFRVYTHTHTHSVTKHTHNTYAKTHAHTHMQSIHTHARTHTYSLKMHFHARTHTHTTKHICTQTHTHSRPRTLAGMLAAPEGQGGRGAAVCDRVLCALVPPLPALPPHHGTPGNELQHARHPDPNRRRRLRGLPR